MKNSAFNRTDVLNELHSKGLPRHIAERYCDKTLSEILNNGCITTETAKRKAIESPVSTNRDERKRAETAEVYKQLTISNAHLGGMHRIAASLIKLED
ncbi:MULTISPECIES: hypothetical protein [Shewanella]|uniref:Uncharacterized protein n=1 Tax=Shewanella electrodiphila TaxID=934143 RepID=A0ABT0KTS4_9GAMM|nr:hypothetical protein [Shewanella electrodiphila]MCL1047009.1 hypothetical protein [Shewanella electrodiphila]